MYEKYEILRDKAGLTDYAVAKEIGVERSTFSNWKRKNFMPKPEKIMKLSKLFGVPMEYFYGDVEETITPVESKLLILLKKHPEIEQIVSTYVHSSEERKDIICQMLGVKREGKYSASEKAV